MDLNRTLVSLFLATLLSITGPSCAKKDAFFEGRELVMQGSYAEALPHLETYLSESPSGPHASRSQFFIAKAHLGLNDHAAARAAFEATRSRYPNSPEAHKAQYKLGVLALVEGNSESAIEIFSTMAENPRGPLAPEAAMMKRFLQSKKPAPAE